MLMMEQGKSDEAEKKAKRMTWTWSEGEKEVIKKRKRR